MDTATKQLQGQVTAKEIAAWKQQYPRGIYAVEANGHIGYFRRPDSAIFNYATFKASTEAYTDFWEAFAEMSFIGGSKAVFENDMMLIGAMPVFREFAYGYPAELVEAENLNDERMQSLTGYADSDQVKKWQSEHNGGIYGISCNDHIGYFRMPDRQVLNNATSVMSPNNFLDYWERIGKETFVGGSNELLNDAEMLRGAVEEFKRVTSGYEAKLVKL